MISFLSYCDGVLYLFLLVLVVLLERGINFVCCSTRCFVAQMETMTAGTVSILHLDTNLPQSHHHHQICTRPMGFEHQSTLQSSHPVISINEHHRINQSEKFSKIVSFLTRDSRVERNRKFRKNRIYGTWSTRYIKIQLKLTSSLKMFTNCSLRKLKIHICSSDHATSDQLEFFSEPGNRNFGNSESQN